MTRPLHVIANEVYADWSTKKVNYAAKPYLDAMRSLDSIHDMYYHDTASSIVRYFLANAGTWRGDVARGIKDELKRMLATT